MSATAMQRGAIAPKSIMMGSGQRVAPFTAGRTYIAPSTSRRKLIFCEALVLTPAGSGSTDHLDEDVSAPQSIKLSEGQFELGREGPAQIVVPFPTVSSRHAMLRIAGDSVSVTDLNSTNGTYIDDDELAPMKAETLNVGQKIIFGDSYLAQYKLEKSSD